MKKFLALALCLLMVIPAVFVGCAKADGAKVKTDLFGEGYKRFDFGLNYNVGVEMWNQWQFFLGFEHSLLNIAKSNIDGEGNIKMRPLNFYIGTAYMF